MKILIIEDDLKVQAFLKENLESEFSVEALDRLPAQDEHQDPPHTIILDRLLGTLDTKNHLPQLRSKFPDSFIIILSAINSPAERSELLDLGADDYMGKPFSIVELKARIRALARRTTKVEQISYIKLSDTVLDINQRTLSRGEKRVGLGSKEYELLYVLAKNVGKVFSKFDLMDKVWQANLEIESNVLEVTVMNLRKKLQEIGSEAQICSKRNRGYWLES